MRACVLSRSVMSNSVPGSSVQGILQARTLEWVAIVFSTKVLRRVDLQKI